MVADWRNGIASMFHICSPHVREARVCIEKRSAEGNASDRMMQTYLDLN
jgi:hypothetical protein